MGDCLFWLRRAAIGTSPLTCPACHASNARRSRRRTLSDYLLSITGVLPWRCQECETRFYSRRVPLRDVVYARCKICGNLELQRIAPEYVSGVKSIIPRILRIPALRCAPCRNKFFSMRPVLREGRRAEATESD